MPHSIPLHRPVLLAILAVGIAAGQPARIVSTTPSITETLFALGLGSRVVGVSTFCRYPPETGKIQKIGTFLQPNAEVILSLRPSLVIIQRNPISLGDRLKAMGLPVVEVNPAETADGVYSSIRTIASACGVPAKGESLIASLANQLRHLRTKAGSLKPVKVAFVVGRTPGTLDGIFVAAKDSYLVELLTIAGGQNVFADSPAAYPKVTIEELLARSPDVILDMGDSTHIGSITEEHRKSVVRLWQRYPMLSAVRNHRVLPVADDRFVVPGPRVAEAVREFGKMLHPEASW
ncbi:MAG: ABC transporter substrate-binding protein [Bryobacterales bacterium]|nr:ABC transporter substrate-binding protein [Bryobacterales bacterium]